MWPRFVPLPSTFLLVGIVLTACFLTFERFTGMETEFVAPQIDVSVPKESSTKNTKVAKSLDSSAIDQLLQRPLFEITRRPQVRVRTTEPVVTVVTKLPPLALRMYGSFVSGDEIRALVSIDENPADWVRIGQTLKGWSVSEITAEKIVLNAGADTLEYELGSGINDE